MRILVFNQYYPPDTAATAQRLADLCEGMAAHHRVTVVCGRPSYDPAPFANGPGGQTVQVVRVWSTAFHRKRMVGRIANYLTYLPQALLRGAFVPRPDVVLAMTDPPIVGFVAWLIAQLKRVPFVYVVQDLYPDVAVALGRIRSRLLVGVLERASRFLLRHADRLVAISGSMKTRMLAKGVPAEAIRVISNWADTDALAPEPKDNVFARRHDLADRFVVMYSGNVGLSQNLERLIEAAKELERTEEVRIVVVGDGAGKPGLVDLAERLELKNVAFLPYEPIATMRYSFAAADVFVISLGTGLDGLVVPSKVFAIMASGRPFIAAVEETSEVAEIVQTYGCGVLVRPGSTAELTRAIEWAHRNRGALRRMGETGRRVVESRYGKGGALAQYGELLDEVTRQAAQRRAATPPVR
jgi:glycosyltransferase involved in cell wall biosynthesis